MESESVFDTHSWISHKSQPPVQPVTLDESLAAVEAIDEGNVLVNAVEEMLGTDLGMSIAVDYKDEGNQFRGLWKVYQRPRSARWRSLYRAKTRYDKTIAI